MRVIKIKDLVKNDTFVGSRYAAEGIRESIKSAIENREQIIIDFEGISGVTQGFIDEAVGIPVRAFGINKALKHVKIINANDKVRLILNWVVNYSKKTSI